MATRTSSLQSPESRAFGNEIVKMQRAIGRLQAGQRSSQLGYSSIENGQIVVYDENGVRKQTIGRGPNGSYGITASNGLPPPKASTPFVVPITTGLNVRWDGLFFADAERPIDFSHMAVHVSPAPNFIVGPSNLIGTLFNAGELIAAPLPGLSIHYVRLVPYNTSGIAGPQSNEATGTPLQVVAQAVINGIINELSLAAGAVTAAKLAAGAVTETAIADDSISTPKLIAGAVQADKLAVNSVTSDKIVSAAITAGKIAALAITADKIAANAINVGHLQAGVVTAEKIQAGIIISDASLQTGVSGRRVLISGADNDIKFFPQAGETRFARMYSYVPSAFPDDITVELRAIDSADVSIVSRLFLEPDRAFLGLTESMDEAVFGGGCVELIPNLGFFGVKTGLGETTSGLTTYFDGQLQFKGGMSRGTFSSTQAFQLQSTAVDSAFGGINISYVDTLLGPSHPVMAVEQQETTGFSHWLSNVSASGFTARWTAATDKIFHAWVIQEVVLT